MPETMLAALSNIRTADVSTSDMNIMARFADVAGRQLWRAGMDDLEFAVAAGDAQLRKRRSVILGAGTDSVECLP
ncbi:MAG: hypothetical protein EOS66_34315 [Mesorhizobium sp.]|nr:MAG: hypothetical protein EOS66_34315 [Mesorhizobium sp.]